MEIREMLEQLKTLECLNNMHGIYMYFILDPSIKLS